MFEQVLWMITGGAMALSLATVSLGVEAAIRAARKPEGDMAEDDEGDLHEQFEEFMAVELARHPGWDEARLLAWWEADDRAEAFIWFVTLCHELEDTLYDRIAAILSDAGGRPATATLH